MVSEGETGRPEGSGATRDKEGDTPARIASRVVKQLRFRPENHVRRGADFERIYGKKIRGSDSHLLIFADANQLNYSRIGLSVSKKQGPAVKRNRLKRLLREAFRLSQPELPVGLDLILIPRQGAQSTVDDYRKSLIQNVRYLARKVRNSSS